MIRSAGFALAACVSMAGYSSVVTTGFGGRLELADANAAFGMCAYWPGWNGSSEGAGGYISQSDGSRSFTLKIGRSPVVKMEGRAVARQQENGVFAEWTMTPLGDVSLECLAATALLPHLRYDGGHALVDGSRRELVAGGKTHIFSGSLKCVEVYDRNGELAFKLDFPVPTSVLLQDNSPWHGSDFSLRVMSTGNQHHFEKGDMRKVAFTLSGKDKMVLQHSGPVKIHADDNWLPIDPCTNILAGSALDFSALCGKRETAGIHGNVIAKGEHFAFADSPDVARRFYGVNLCFTANIPDEEAAKRLATHLARTGYNAVRIHHHETVLVAKGADATVLDDAKMRRFDRLLSELIANGIYLTTDLFVSRQVPCRAIGLDEDGCVPMGDFKLLVQFYPPAFANYLAFARNFLSHVNSFTGRSYAREPALAWLSFVNEGNIGNQGFGLFRKYSFLRESWEKWLEEKKRTDSAYAAVSSAIPENQWNSSDHLGAFVQFLREAETSFARRVTAFLRNEMKCAALTTNMNCWYYPAAYFLPKAEEYDYVDDHFYVDHPNFLECSWSLPSSCPNANPFVGGGRGVPPVAARRVFGRPFTITEYNYSGPGRFRGVGGIAAGAAGALQDWAGMWRFAWSHSEDGVRNFGRQRMGYFDMSGDPLSFAAERASLCLFLRGDMAPLSGERARILSDAEMRSPSAAASKQVKGADGADGWNERIGVDVLECATAGKSGKGGGMVVDSKRGAFVIDTPCTQGGFAENGGIDSEFVHVKLSSSPATVWVSSLDGLPIDRSAHLLVTHLTDVQNTDITYADRDLRILLQFGRLPHLMRKGEADVSIRVKSGSWKVYPLASDGSRRAESAATCENGLLRFRTDIVNGYIYEACCK